MNDQEKEEFIEANKGATDAFQTDLIALIAKHEALDDRLKSSVLGGRLCEIALFMSMPKAVFVRILGIQYDMYVERLEKAIKELKGARNEHGET